MSPSDLTLGYLDRLKSKSDFEVLYLVKEPS